ncbi:MAG: DUF2905 domain-containing protein [Desulfuromonadales bacterium]|nr:DUF2905 domain-containing protein [Desulfuromonadales bacterium]
MLGKSLITIGLLLVVVGLYVSLGGKLPPLGRLPGDIHIERDNFSLYVPLGTCLLVSLGLSLLFWLLRK